jgi:DNA-binding FrmR family transcriptional regulator
MSNHQHHDVEKICQRLNRVEGQLGGIRKMLESDEPCDEIIIQLNSAKAALQRIGQIVLEDHLEHCVVDALREGDREPELDSMKRAISQYTKMA